MTEKYTHTIYGGMPRVNISSVIRVLMYVFIVILASFNFTRIIPEFRVLKNFMEPNLALHYKFFILF